MQFIIDSFGHPDALVGHDGGLVGISRHYFSDSHFLFAHFEDIPFPDGVFLGIGCDTFLGRLLMISQRGLWTNPYFS